MQLPPFAPFALPAARQVTLSALRGEKDQNLIVIDLVTGESGLYALHMEMFD